jgi:hypothetical protein
MSYENLEVSARSGVAWPDMLPDGFATMSALRSVAIEVGYPDFANPLGSDGNPYPVFRSVGVSHVPGQEPREAQLMRWSRDNQEDVFAVSFPKLDSAVAGWDVDDVAIRKTAVFDPQDPRVDLSGGGSTYVSEKRTKNHQPVITVDEVGQVYVRFSLDRPIHTGNISMTLACMIGGRRDVFTISRENFRNVVWEIFSDKYIEQTCFKYELSVTVAGPCFDDEPIRWGTSAPVEVALPPGRVKYLSRVVLPLPPVPPEKKDEIDRFIHAAAAAP